MDSAEEIVAGLINPDDATNETYKWDGEFQKQILGMLLTDKNFLIQSASLIKPDYFVDEVHKLIARLLFKIFEKNKFLPSKVILKQEIQDAIREKDDKVKFKYFTELTAVYDYYVPGIEARDYLLDKITNFAKVQALKNGFTACLDHLKKFPESEETWMKIHTILREAMQVDRNFDIGLEYFQTFDTRCEINEKDELKERFTTGFPKIDAALTGNGGSRKEMYSVMGLPGVGKSLWLVNAAIKNIMLGWKVLYISLEIDEVKTAQRFDAQIANVGINDLRIRKDEVKKALAEQISGLEDQRLLVIKQFPGGMMDVAMLRAYYSQIVLNGFRPDMVIIDYVGEMKDFPGMPTWESRYRIVRDLRGFATEENVFIMTAMQPNKSAREAQKIGVIDDDNLADAFGQTRPLDGLWSINQTQEEKECGVARIFVIKHRHGKSRFQIHIEYNSQTLGMSEIHIAEYERRIKKYTGEKTMDRANNTGYELNDKLTGGEDTGEKGKKGKKKDGKNLKDKSAEYFKDNNYEEPEELPPSLEE